MMRTSFFCNRGMKRIKNGVNNIIEGNGTMTKTGNHANTTMKVDEHFIRFKENTELVYCNAETYAYQYRGVP